MKLEEFIYNQLFLLNKSNDRSPVYSLAKENMYRFNGTEIVMEIYFCLTSPLQVAYVIDIYWNKGPDKYNDFTRISKRIEYNKKEIKRYLDRVGKDMETLSTFINSFAEDRIRSVNYVFYELKDFILREYFSFDVE